MEIYSIAPSCTEQPFQRNRDTTITTEPLSLDRQFSREQIDQQTNFSSFHHAVEYLKTVEKLFVQQNIALLEIVLDVETSNKYQILDPLGQKVFLAAEESGFCIRILCGPIRSFEMHIYDNLNNEVIRMHRHWGCICCPFALQKLEVFCPTDVLVGYVQQRFDLCRPKFGIFDKDGMKVLDIEGPSFFSCHCCVDRNYEVKRTTGEVIGVICKQWTGLLLESFTDADLFRLEFPLDLDVNLKMVLLGATFLIDYMYYEKKK